MLPDPFGLSLAPASQPWLRARRPTQWLFGTASTWFLLDIAYYCQNLFTPKVVGDIGYSVSVKPGSTGSDLYHSVFANVTGTAIIILMGLVPGYFVTVGGWLGGARAGRAWRGRARLFGGAPTLL